MFFDRLPGRNLRSSGHGGTSTNGRWTSLFPRFLSRSEGFCVFYYSLHLISEFVSAFSCPHLPSHWITLSPICRLYHLWSVATPEIIHPNLLSYLSLKFQTRLMPIMWPLAVSETEPLQPDVACCCMIGPPPAPSEDTHSKPGQCSHIRTVIIDHHRLSTEATVDEAPARSRVFPSVQKWL